ncbi:MAG: hypothetical protein ACI82F_003526 [Planctomycetota bacterium]|jgi:hypothetical protein
MAMVGDAFIASDRSLVGPYAAASHHRGLLRLERTPATTAGVNPGMGPGGEQPAQDGLALPSVVPHSLELT